jgi:hypothetical protein
MNPYESPSASDAPPEARRDRPALLERALNQLARGGDRPAARDPETGQLILNEGWIPRAWWGFVAFGCPIGFGILALADPPAPDEWYVVGGMMAGLLLLGGGFLLATVKRRVLVSAEGLAGEALFSRRRSMAWTEVTSARCSDGTLTLASEDKRRIKVEPFMVGVTEFAELLEQRLPLRIQEEFQRDLDRFHAFVGR